MRGGGFCQEGLQCCVPGLSFDISALCMAEAVAWVAAWRLFIGCEGNPIILPPLLCLRLLGLDSFWECIEEVLWDPPGYLGLPLISWPNL